MQRKGFSICPYYTVRAYESNAFVQHGMQLPELQQILGHASLSTVLIYAHADAEMKRKAIEKATISNRIVKDVPIKATYKDDETIRKLCGLR